jgi:hypothetical protein
MIGPLALLAGVLCAYGRNRHPALRVLAAASLMFGVCCCVWQHPDAAAGVFEACWVIAVGALAVTFLGPVVRR